MPNAPNGARPPARPLAPHIQAAVGRIAQARMALPTAGPTRQPAAHVRAAVNGVAQAKPGAHLQARPAAHVQAAMQRAAQAKPSASPQAAAQRAQAKSAHSRPRQLAPAVHSPRPAGAARPGILQMMEDQQELPKNIIGEVRDGETVKTAGGTWRATRYVAVKRLDHAPAWGASMRLEFTPEYPADATKIALVQTVSAFKNAGFHYVDETAKKRSVAGASIDQHGESRSPLYAEAPETGDGALGSSLLQENAGEHGYRYWDTDQKAWKTKAAWLKDTPHFRGVVSFSKQTFETTAVALAGGDKGLYYGSVSWGWRLNGDGEVILDPLAVESRGSASDQFKESAAKWNKTLTSLGEVPQQLPPVKEREVIEVPVNRTRDNPTFTAITDDML